MSCGEHEKAEKTERQSIEDIYEALDNMDDYALIANVKPIGPHKVLTDAISELEQLRNQRDEMLAALIEIHDLRPAGKESSEYALTVEYIARAAIASVKGSAA